MCYWQVLLALLNLVSVRSLLAMQLSYWPITISGFLIIMACSFRLVLDWIVLLLVLICHERQLNATLSISILKEAYVLLGQYLYFETDNAPSYLGLC
jgi:hypothetical protein